MILSVLLISLFLMPKYGNIILDHKFTSEFIGAIQAAKSKEVL